MSKITTPPQKTQDGVRRSDKWERRRQAIIDESAKVFAQLGYHATSTVELCEANINVFLRRFGYNYARDCIYTDMALDIGSDRQTSRVLVMLDSLTLTADGHF